MRDLKTSIVGFVLGGLCLTLAAAPKDPNVGFDSVTSFPEAVTLSSDRYDTRVSYRVVVKNHHSNSLNRSFYDGVITLTGATTNDAVIESTFSEIPGLSDCSIATPPTSVHCVLGNGGTIEPGMSVSFWVTVLAPTTGTKMTLSSTFGGDEGNGGGNGCCNSTTSTSTDLVDPVTGSTTFKSSAKSFIQGTTGGEFFTGLDKAATPDDPWVTIVTVPEFTSGLSVGGPPLPFTTAILVETLNLQSCAPYALANGCFFSDLTMPGSFNSLSIVIRWDASKIKPGTKPENVKLFYTNDPNVAPVQLQLCGPSGPITQPCLESIPIKHSKQSVPDQPSWWGDLEFRVKAPFNGRYSN